MSPWGDGASGPMKRGVDYTTPGMTDPDYRKVAAAHNCGEECKGERHCANCGAALSQVLPAGTITGQSPRANATPVRRLVDAAFAVTNEIVVQDWDGGRNEVRVTGEKIHELQTAAAALKEPALSSRGWNAHDLRLLSHLENFLRTDNLTLTERERIVFADLIAEAVSALRERTALQAPPLRQQVEAALRDISDSDLLVIFGYGEWLKAPSKYPGVSHDAAHWMRSAVSALLGEIEKRALPAFEAVRHGTQEEE